MSDYDKLSSEALATKIVLFRTLGLQREASVAAMNELTIRKAAGDAFDYEQWIADQIKTFPILKQK